MHIKGNKVFVSRAEVAVFNAKWPCSELRATRSYWFDFDANGDLVDTDVPEHDDGPAASAMAEDCKKALFNDSFAPEWMLDETLGGYRA